MATVEPIPEHEPRRWVPPYQFDAAIHQRDAARRLAKRLATEIRRYDHENPVLVSYKRAIKDWK